MNAANRHTPVAAPWRILGVAALMSLASCGSNADAGPSPGVWVDRVGDVLPVTTVYSTVGPAHCDWQSATILSLGVTEPGAGRDYFRDPNGVFASYTSGTYAADTTLPANAVETGYHRGRLDLVAHSERRLRRESGPCGALAGWRSTSRLHLTRGAGAGRRAYGALGRRLCRGTAGRRYAGRGSRR